MTSSKATIVVDNRVRLMGTQLPEAALQDLVEAFTHSNPEYHKQLAMGRRYTAEPATIETYSHDTRDRVSFPRGGMQRVRDILSKHGVGWVVSDKRSHGDLGMGKLPGSKVNFWDHQDSALDAALEVENCLVRSPTGSGKTTIAIAIASRVKTPTMIVVRSSALLEQWRSRIAQELGVHEGHVGWVQGKKFELRAITVAMQQTLHRLSDDEWATINEKFGCVILDEVQCAASDTVFATIDRFEARYRFGFSDDERRKDRKQFLTYDLFGKVAAEVDDDDLIAKGIIHAVHVVMVETQFEAPWYQEAAIRGENPDFNRLLEEIAKDATRNSLIGRLMREHCSARHPGIVLSHRVAHCQHLASLVSDGDSGLLLGGDEWADAFETTVERLKARKIKVGVGTYQAAKQGIDIPELEVGIAATPLVNNKQVWRQTRGRICRKAAGKKGATFYVPWDRQVFGSMPIQNMIRWNSSVEVRTLSGEQVSGKQYLEKYHAETRRHRAVKIPGLDYPIERGD